MEFTAKDLLKLEHVMEDQGFQNLGQLIGYLEDTKNFQIESDTRVDYMEVTKTGIYFEPKKNYSKIEYEEGEGYVLITLKRKDPDPNTILYKPGDQVFYIGKTLPELINRPVVILNVDHLTKSYTVCISQVPDEACTNPPMR